MIKVNFNLPMTWWQQLGDIATKKGSNRSEMIRQAIEQFLKNNE
jgi:metal-responsive CopG/Arc/MetJ family transcriptional regulator